MTGSILAALLIALGLLVNAHVKQTSLDHLTLPADRRSAECALTASRPVTGLAQDMANPWMGTAPRVIARIRSLVEGGAQPFPDGPPLTARQAARFSAKYTEGVTAAYAASYEQPGFGEVRVYGLEFVTEKEAGRSLLLGTTAGDPKVIRVGIGRISIVIQNLGAETCFALIHDYIRGLR